jgi:hypothetical protein
MLVPLLFLGGGEIIPNFIQGLMPVFEILLHRKVQGANSGVHINLDINCAIFGSVAKVWFRNWFEPKLNPNQT